MKNIEEFSGEKSPGNGPLADKRQDRKSNRSRQKNKSFPRHWFQGKSDYVSVTNDLKSGFVRGTRMNARIKAALLKGWIQGSLFASDIKMCTGTCLDDVTLTRKQYMTNIAY